MGITSTLGLFFLFFELKGAKKEVGFPSAKFLGKAFYKPTLPTIKVLRINFSELRVGKDDPGLCMCETGTTVS